MTSSQLFVSFSQNSLPQFSVKSREREKEKEIGYDLTSHGMRRHQVREEVSQHAMQQEVEVKNYV